MRIALFHNLLSGGGKRALFNLARLLSNDYDLDLYSLNGGNFLKLDVFCNNVYRYKLTDFSSFLDYLVFIYTKLSVAHERIAKDIDERNYDVVFVNPDYITKAPFVLRFLKTPTLYLCQEPPREFYENISLYSYKMKDVFVNLVRYPLKHIDYKNASKADLILSNSNYSKKVLSRIYKKKVGVLRHGIDASKFRFLNRKRSNIFLTVASLSRFKGIDFLIKSISRLPVNMQFPLYIVCDGGRDYAYITQLAKRSKVKIIVKSGLSDKELVFLYNKAFLFLFAAINEPLGLCLIEAQACGLPVVAVNEGGVAEVVNKKYSYLTTRCFDNFTDLLKETIENINPQQRRKLSHFVRNKFKWEDSYNDLKKYLKLTKRGESL